MPAAVCFNCRSTGGRPRSVTVDARIKAPPPGADEDEDEASCPDDMNKKLKVDGFVTHILQHKEVRGGGVEVHSQRKAH
ncbi:hypothetical protein EYF80_036229 [Liparis tanakae]|uniref:Uncharacterized protein n=1 Tax=Liparis tanakae TaxID=230148 RepID=A0A4Z2GJR8_9TELE|nr:hypothetical protein EYF80_036229 [Liparis tanakae]